ncbi:MAG: DUF2071 domain-containing protein [Chloroflexota bacterium]|nr:DUF2071 domain-containing protein [Chloroflexota bacterium]
MPLRDLFRIDDLLRPALLVSWAVPAARVRPLVPAQLALDTVAGPDGAPLALLTVAAVLNVGMHPRPLPALRTTCAQANYRTYVRGRDGAPGVYFFANFVAGRAGWFLPWLLSPHVYYAPARMSGRLPAHPTPAARWDVQLTMRSALGPTQITATGRCDPLTDAAYWLDPATAARFLSQRLTGYLRDRRGRVWALPVDHQEMAPWPGTVAAITCAPWQHWGLLSATETAQPFSVLLQPAVLFRAFVPRLG